MSKHIYRFYIVTLTILLGLNLESNLCYFLFAVLAAVTVLDIIIKRKIKKWNVFSFDILPGILLLCWLYAFILGIYRGNLFEYIIANNAAMVMYCFYYWLIQIKLTKEAITKILLHSYVLIAITTTILYILDSLHIHSTPFNPILGEYLGGASTGQRRIYFVAQISLFGPFSYYLSRLISSYSVDKKLSSLYHLEAIHFLYLTIVIVFFTASKGFMLGFLLLFFLLIFSFGSKSIKHGKFNIKILSGILAFAIFLIAITILGYSNIIFALFDHDDEANVLRYEQLYYLLNDLTLTGKGLGAIIPGYSRNDLKPYGFELSFLNLIHKFGIVSIIIVSTYILTIGKAIYNIIKGINIKYSVFSLGAMMFIIPAIGNPVLFAPQAVILHCFSIYLLRTNEEKSLGLPCNIQR